MRNMYLCVYIYIVGGFQSQRAAPIHPSHSTAPIGACAIADLGPRRVVFIP